MKKFTSYIFADMDFFTGMASAFNLSGNFYPFNTSDTPDMDALGQDAAMIAQDAWGVIDEQEK